MVVWGGYGGTLLNTGGRYDPATDTWTATSTVEAPSARSSHTAIWTGAVMVVWGGTSSGYVNTGGQYDPATDAWTATSTVEAPSARSSHTVIWTGSVMVIWGGTSGSALNTGGRYDPATDTWTATSTVEAPSGRYYHTAIWTGSVMVVWGGNSSGYVNTGGQYDPPADTWTATSTLEAPSIRQLHTAVRTGGLMVVWGGIGFSSGHFNNGGRYAPLGYSVDNDGDGLRECDGDCDDANPNTFPGAPEICDHLDNDCDGQTDEGVTTTYYRDADGDTYGNSSDSLPACTQPPGYVTDGSDCDDGNAAVHPGAVETCNSVDDDCDGAVDEGCPAQVLNPDNGHYYMAVSVPTGINWIDADAAARSESLSRVAGLPRHADVGGGERVRRCQIPERDRTDRLLARWLPGHGRSRLCRAGRGLALGDG